MLVNEFLEISVEKFPDKVALVSENKRLIYSEIEQMANQVAHALVERGIRRGDRIAIFLPNTVEAVIAAFAVVKAGGVFLVINRTTKLKKLSYMLNNCRAAALFTDAKALIEIDSEYTVFPHLQFVVLSEKPVVNGDRIPYVVQHEIYGSFPVTRPNCRNIDIDLAALIYTSGSTGNPKGVMLTHLNIVSAATSITHYLNNESSDIIINTLPLSFDYGLYQLLMSFKIGGTLLLEKSFSYPFSVIKKILKERVTGFPIVPTMAAIIVKMEGLGKYNFDHLRYISNTAAHLPTTHISALREIFPRTKIYCMYGLTECKRVSYLPPDQLDRKPGSVGRGMPNEEVFIVDEKGERLGPGAVGELVVRGSNVMKGYWELPNETERVLRQGAYPWEKVLYTGDLFKMDDEGFLYFVARKDDIIKSRGEKVSPKEIEEVLYTLPGVKEAAVIGVKDAILGEAIKAVIVVASGNTVTEQQVKSHCAQNLEDFMVPQVVEFCSSLPKTGSGKIKKAALQSTT